MYEQAGAQRHQPFVCIVLSPALESVTTVCRITSYPNKHGSTLVYCWANVVDVGPTVNQCLANVCVFLGYDLKCKDK